LTTTIKPDERGDPNFLAPFCELNGWINANEKHLAKIQSVALDLAVL
jgi:hypothetical protein